MNKEFIIEKFGLNFLQFPQTDIMEAKDNNFSYLLFRYKDLHGVTIFDLCQRGKKPRVLLRTSQDAAIDAAVQFRKERIERPAYEKRFDEGKELEKMLYGFLGISNA